MDANGGTVAPRSKKVTYKKEFGNLPTPTRSDSDYTFTGWYTAKTGGKIVSSKTKMPAKNMVIYAQWRYDSIDVDAETKKLVGTWKYEHGIEEISFYSNGKFYFKSHDHTWWNMDGNYRVLSKKEMLKPNNNIPEILLTNHLVTYSDGRSEAKWDIILKFSCWKDTLYENLKIGYVAETSMASATEPIAMGDIYKKIK